MSQLNDLNHEITSSHGTDLPSGMPNVQNATSVVASPMPQLDCYPCGTPKRPKPASNTTTNTKPCCGVTETSPTTESSSNPQPIANQGIDRRTMLIGAGATAVAVAGASYWRAVHSERAAVFIARNQRYNGTLVTTIREGLLAAGIEPATLRNQRVLLKPNLVEPSRLSPQMTTHPAMVIAAAQVFQSWGASVTVGEGPGHVRDTENALYEAGLADALDEHKIPFADLNYEETAWVKNRGGASSLAGFYFPRTVVEADLIVSMPKLKTHHWVGLTASMKNLYGVIPGIRYGWPKNVLHFNGIPETIHDINASVPRTIGIIDAIECMEGDGPILGTSKQLGLVMIGQNMAALDATAARIMGLVPERVHYLQLAGHKLGPIANGQIDQRGEDWQNLVNPFAVIDEPHLRMLVSQGTQLIT